MTETDTPTAHGRLLAMLIFAICIGAVALTWAGNALLTEPLGGEPAQFTHAVALLAALAAASAVWTLTARLVGGDRS